MFKCGFCGIDNPGEKARFCVDCGREGPSKDWTTEDNHHPLKVTQSTEDVDQSLKVAQYVSMLGEFYFDAQSESAVEKFSLRTRERLKISYDTHVSILEQFARQKKAIAHLANFRIEFNEAVIDAYAGHDTFLTFRYTNLSDDDLFKVSLEWLGPETSDRINLRAQTSSFVKPKTDVTLGATIIFERMGIKELAGMLITITDQFGESAIFKAEPIRFRVGSHEQKVTQITSTHNQISIEGRGVVDASGMGADKTTAQLNASNQPKWKELAFSYVLRNLPQPVLAPKATPEEALQQKTEPIETAKAPTLVFDKSDPLSVLKAAEQGRAEAKKNLVELQKNEVESTPESARNESLDEDIALWKQAEALDTVDSYMQYINLTKLGKFTGWAATRIDVMLPNYRKTARQGSAELKPPLNDSLDEETKLWKQAEALDTSNSYRQYITLTILGKFTGWALTRIETVSR